VKVASGEWLGGYVLGVASSTGSPAQAIQPCELATRNSRRILIPRNIGAFAIPSLLMTPGPDREFRSQQQQHPVILSERGGWA